MIKIILNIQSFSDIITNSSSELFAVIDGNKEIINQVYELVNHIFGYNQESEITPCVYKIYRPVNKDDYYSFWRKEEDSNYPEVWIEIELPYNCETSKTFFRAGLEAILKEKFGDNVKITYYEED